jgi:hypothetical protein
MAARGRRVRVIAVTLAVAAMGFGVVGVPAASAGGGLKSWRFGISRHLSDSRVARISDGDYFSGRVRFIDNWVSASKQRFRNSRRGKRKRVYLVRGTVAIRNKDDYNVIGVGCKQKSPRGTFMLLTTHGERAFFPRPANHIEQQTGEGTIGLSLANLSVSLPFPAFSYYTSTSVAPNVGWSSLSSSVQNWSWTWDDGHPNDVLLGFAGYWEGPARAISYTVRCEVLTVHDKWHFSRAVLRMKRKASR